MQARGKRGPSRASSPFSVPPHPRDAPRTTRTGHRRVRWTREQLALPVKQAQRCGGYGPPLRLSRTRGGGRARRHGARSSLSIGPPRPSFCPSSTVQGISGQEAAGTARHEAGRGHRPRWHAQGLLSCCGVPHRHKAAFFLPFVVGHDASHRDAPRCVVPVDAPCGRGFIRFACQVTKSDGHDGGSSSRSGVPARSAKKVTYTTRSDAPDSSP